MIQLSKKIFQKSFSISSLEYLNINTKKFYTKPEYEDEFKPNPDYNKDHYNDKKYM